MTILFFFKLVFAVLGGGEEIQHFPTQTGLQYKGDCSFKKRIYVWGTETTASYLAHAGDPCYSTVAEVWTELLALLREEKVDLVIIPH